MTPRFTRWRRWAARQLIRAASTVTGVYIEYRQVQAGEHASLTLVVFGLWLMAVPPALWLDSLRRAITAAERARPSGLPAPTDKEKADS